MSVVTRVSSSILSILKPQHLGGPRTSIHKVRFQLPSNLRQVFLNYKNGSGIREYEDLICTLRDTEISDEDLLNLLEDAKSCVSLLDHDLRLFIQALILLKWTYRKEDVVLSYQQLMNDVVSAHTHHTKVIIDNFVKLFLAPYDLNETEEWFDGIPLDQCQLQFKNVHFILHSVLVTVPMSEDLLYTATVSSFPYLKVKAHIQESYVYNILQIMKYKPCLKLALLQLLIDKLIILDVNASREEIQKAEEECDPDIFEIEMSDIRQTVGMKHPLGNTLDILLRLLFKYIRDQCYNEDDTLNWPKCKSFYNDLLYIFENTILLTHASHHVQFLMFYLTSFKNSIAEAWLSFLWKKVSTPLSPSVIRKNAVAYLSSYLARANFVNIGVLKSYLTEMSNWVHSYIETHEGVESSKFNVANHSVFYSICQALFYLIAFRHKDLMDSKKQLVFLESLNLSKIVTSRLNPLRVCLPAVIQNFAAVTRTYQLVYCYTIIENNSRNSIPLIRTGEHSTSETTVQVIDMYFPFDPYVLTRTSCYISPLYREYHSVLNIGTCDKSEPEVVINDDEDDFIPEQGLDIQNALSKNSNTYDFSYSDSPGFKQNMSL